MVRDEQGDGKHTDWKNWFWKLLSYVPMVAIVVLLVLYWSLN